jgi:CRP-like cAMP-binding protein
MKGLPGFRTLPPAERRRLEEASEVRAVERGARLFEAGTPSTHVWAVLEGVVHIVRQGPGGREVVVEIIPAGELFGAVVALDDDPYPATAVAVEPSVVWRAPSPLVRALAQLHPTLRSAILEHVTSRLRHAHARLQSMALEPVEQRLARTLVMLAERIGVPREGETEVAVTRQELADMAGTTVETAIRATGAWKRAGIVATVRSHIRVVDHLALRAIAAGRGART